MVPAMLEAYSGTILAIKSTKNFLFSGLQKKKKNRLVYTFIYSIIYLVVWGVCAHGIRPLLSPLTGWVPVIPHITTCFFFKEKQNNASVLPERDAGNTQNTPMLHKEAKHTPRDFGPWTWLGSNGSNPHCGLFGLSWWDWGKRKGKKWKGYRKKKIHVLVLDRPPS